MTDALAVLKPLLEDRSVLKIGQDIKYDWVILKRHGIDMRPFDDTMLISYVLDAGKGPHGMDELAKRHLGHTPMTWGEVAGTGKSKVTFDRVDLDKATAYAAEDADVTLRLWQVLKPRLPAEGRATPYETLERPLIDVIGRMEMRGISVDRQILSRLSGDFAQSLARLEDEIQEIAGEKFNLGSPKQIGDILFGKMGLPGAKKTPSGQWATPATLLDELAQAGHLLPEKILEWRQLSKLKSTYTDSLQQHMHPETKRVHTSYALASTTTGRLSSSEPNLQNIPIRTEAGRKIRRAFVAPAGSKIISADYSQIELRLLAHIADIPQLQEAFAQDIDVHAATASAMFGVPLDQMTPDLRRQRQDDQFRHHLRHLGLRPGAAPEHPARRGGGVHPAVFRALPRHSHLHGRHQEGDAAKTATSPPCSAASAIIRRSNRAIRTSARASSARPSTRRSRAAPPTSSAAPWCAWRMHCAKSACRRACCCRFTTNWCSRPPTRRSTRRCRSSPA